MKLKEVMDKLDDAHIVGGTVRDMLLKFGCDMPDIFTSCQQDLGINDIDVATSDKPDMVLSKFPNNSYTIGKKFGTVCVRTEDFGDVEVTTFRSDTGGRHPEVCFIGDLSSDLARRDFTINALAIDRDGNLKGSAAGIFDMGKGVIRCVGNPEDRILSECGGDELRAIRALRFAIQLDFDIEQKTADVIKYVMWNGVSKERIRDELFKMFDINAQSTIKILDQYGLLHRTLPGISNMKECAHNPEHHPEGDVYAHTLAALQAADEFQYDPLSKLAVCMHDIGKPLVLDQCGNYHGHAREGSAYARSILENMRLPSDDIDAVVFAVENHMKMYEFDNMRPAKKRRLLMHDNFNVLLNVYIADRCARIPDEFGRYTTEIMIRHKFKHAVEDLCNEVTPLITGRDLIDMGLKPGKIFSTILEEVEDRQVANEISTKEEAVELAKSLSVCRQQGM